MQTMQNHQWELARERQAEILREAAKVQRLNEAMPGQAGWLTQLFRQMQRPVTWAMHWHSSDEPVARVAR
jgi:hypothetical protein